MTIASVGSPTDFRLAKQADLPCTDRHRHVEHLGSERMSKTVSISSPLPDYPILAERDAPPVVKQQVEVLVDEGDVDGCRLR